MDAGQAMARAIAEAIRAPLPLAYHPLYRFYRGGALTRAFRGLPARPDDWWSEDWVGSCTCAGNDDPGGKPQGLSLVELPGAAPVTLQSVVEAAPEEMLGTGFAGRFGPQTGVLVKLLSPAGRVPVHAHPTRAWAREHLGSAFGKTEAWILLETPGDGTEPAYAGVGFRPGVTREWFADAVRRHDHAALRGALHRTSVEPGQVYVAHAGVPHYLGPQLSFIEVQEPSDHIVIAETDGPAETAGAGAAGAEAAEAGAAEAGAAGAEGAGAKAAGAEAAGAGAAEAGATMGLGWDLALDMIDYGTADAAATLGRARQQPRVLRTTGGSREVQLLGDDVTEFFDATALEVADEIEVSDGRFSIAIVTAGHGWAEGEFGRVPIRRGQTFAWPASLVLRVRADREPVRVVRCMGPRP